jgi:hypothetical protein
MRNPTERRATEAARLSLSLSRRDFEGELRICKSAQRSRSIPLNVLEITLPLASSTMTPCPEKMVPNRLERTKPSEVTVTVPSLCCPTEKLPERLILIVFPVSRLVAVPTNGPDPKISPSLKTKRFMTSGAVGWMRTGKLHASSVNGPCGTRSMNGFVAPAVPARTSTPSVRAAVTPEDASSENSLPRRGRDDEATRLFPRPSDQPAAASPLHATFVAEASCLSAEKSTVVEFHIRPSSWFQIRFQSRARWTKRTPQSTRNPPAAGFS